MTQVSYDASVKIVSHLQSALSAITVYGGTTEVDTYKKDETVFGGTTEIDSYKHDETVYGGTTEVSASSPVKTETVYGGATEIYETEMATSLTVYPARARSGINGEGSITTYLRSRSEIRDVKVWPENFQTKIVDSTTAKLPVVFLQWRLEDYSMQLLGKDIAKKLVWDSLFTLSWDAPFGTNLDTKWFFLTYREHISDPDLGTERPIQYSLPETTDTTPTLIWESDDNSDGHDASDLEYEIEVSLNPNMQDLVYNTTEAWSSGEYTSHTITTTLVVGKRYYWRVRLYDELEYGPWSVTKHFDIVASRYSTVPNPMVQDVLIPGHLRHYHWDTSNLAGAESDGTLIKRKVYLYTYEGSNGTFTKTSTVPVEFPRTGIVPDDCIYIDHSAPNPPVFTIAGYDTYNHYVLLGIKITDSMARKYNLVDFRYRDDRYIEGPWISIPKSRIIGITDNIGPSADKTIIGMFTWTASYDPDNAYNAQQQVYYDLKALSTPVMRDNSFYWAVQQYLRGSSDYDLTHLGWGSGSAWWADHDTQTIPVLSWTDADSVAHSENADVCVMTDDDDETYEAVVTNNTSVAITITLPNAYFVERVDIDAEDLTLITAEHYVDGEWVSIGQNIYPPDTRTIFEYFSETHVASLRITVKAVTNAKIYAINIWGRPNKIIGDFSVEPVYVDESTTDFVSNTMRLDWSGYTATDPDVIDPKTFRPESQLPPFRIAPSRVRYQVVLSRESDGTTTLYSLAGISTQATDLDPVDLFTADVTNVVLLKDGLTDNTYQMTSAEKDLFGQKIGNNGFYWTVRAYDDLDSSIWAPFAEYTLDYIHYLLWDVSDMELFPGDKYKVSCYMYLSAANESGYQVENLRWNDALAMDKLLPEAIRDAETDIVQPEIESSIERVDRLINARNDDPFTFTW